jgi:Holliday junction resolvase RusA-like endonuclease
VIRIEVLGPPRGKGRVWRGPNGGAFRPPATEKYEGNLNHEAKLAMYQAGQLAPLEGPLSLVVTAYFPVPGSWSKKQRAAALEHLIRPAKKPDADNLLKMMDALNEVVWRDDAQIVDAQVAKFYSDRPRIVIVVEPL